MSEQHGLNLGDILYGMIGVLPAALLAYVGYRDKNKEQKVVLQQDNLTAEETLNNARKITDAATQDTISELRVDNTALRVRVREEHGNALEWERRARRADKGWHRVNHMFRNYLQKVDDRSIDIPPVPYLEDPLTPEDERKSKDAD